MRADVFISEKFNISRSQAKDLILRQKVFVNGSLILKVSTKIFNEDEVIIEGFESLYVSRAGNKLERAIKFFNIDLKDKIGLDIGSSTGGFTECLLRYGIKEVYSVDVGKEQMDSELKKDERIHLFEETDIRDFSKKNIKFDIIVCDVSFISVENILNDIISMSKVGTELVLLIKPQFEVGKSGVTKRGIVKNDRFLDKAIFDVKQIFLTNGFKFYGIIESPIKGKSGNKEFLSYFVYR